MYFVVVKTNERIEGTTGSKNNFLLDNVKDRYVDNFVLYISMRISATKMLIYRAQLRQGNGQSQKFRYE